MTAAAVAAVISAHRFTYLDEGQLQEGIAGALTARGMSVLREVRLSGRDRIDLLVGRVGVEVKVKGGAAPVLRQLQRYAHSDQIDCLLLVTTMASHLDMPGEIGGKPLAVCCLLAGAL